MYAPASVAVAEIDTTSAGGAVGGEGKVNNRRTQLLAFPTQLPVLLSILMGMPAVPIEPLFVKLPAVSLMWPVATVRALVAYDLR